MGADVFVIVPCERHEARPSVVNVPAPSDREAIMRSRNMHR